MISRRQQNWPDYARWSACFAVVLLTHVAGAAMLLARWDDSGLMANPPVITIDLAPIAAAPEIVPTDIPVGPPQVETPPDEPPPPPPQDIAVEPPKPPKKPPEKKKVAKLTTAPAPAEQRAEREMAPAEGASGSNMRSNWISQLVAQIERHKRYRGTERGTARVAFNVDRSGGVHNAHVVASSGSSELDREALALMERSQPLPPPPPEVSGSQIAIVVPIRYNNR